MASGESSFESTIKEILSRAAVEIAAAARAQFAAEVKRILDGVAAMPSATRQRQPKAPEKVAGVKAGAAKPAARPAKQPPKIQRPAKAAGGRRTSAEIAADNSKLLAFVAAHPGLNSEQLQKEAGLPKPHLTAGLGALRKQGRIRMAGIKRGATYTAA